MIRRADHVCCLIAIAALAVSPVRAQQPPLALHIHSEHAMFQVLISPGHVGTDSFVLQLMSGDGDMLPAKEATLTLSLPERGIGPLAHKATLGGDGYWHVADVPIPQPGRWHLRIEARTAAAKITLEDDVEVPAR
jgi:copper transport protein